MNVRVFEKAVTDISMKEVAFEKSCSELVENLEVKSPKICEALNLQTLHIC